MAKSHTHEEKKLTNFSQQNIFKNVLKSCQMSWKLSEKLSVNFCVCQSIDSVQKYALSNNESILMSYDS